MFKFSFIALSFYLSCFSLPSLASTIQLQSLTGIKFPNSSEEGTHPVFSQALAPVHWQDLKGFNELLPYVTPVPDQEDANSCMLMSLTGVVEWWLHRLAGNTQFVPNGDLDLSERWWMNLSEKSHFTKKVNYWFTDAIYLFNSSPAVLNHDYPLRKGWYVETEDDVTPALPSEAKAEYGIRYSWADETSQVASPNIELPKFGRRVLFANEQQDPWVLGTAPDDIADKVMAAFQKYKAPIQVIYNHEGFWHSVYVIGYDEEMSSEGCPFIQYSADFFQKEYDDAIAKGKEKTARRFLRLKTKLAKSLESGGGCHPKGMFYVRDSQYPDPAEETYVYDPQNPASNKPYSARVVLREFDWLRTMASHISVIYVKDSQSN